MGTQIDKNDKKDNQTNKPIVSKKMILLIALGLLVFAVLIFLSPLFGITEVQISEVKLYSSEEIYSAFESYEGSNGFIALFENTTLAQVDNVFRLRYTEKEKNMLFDYPLIKDIKVEYDMPGKLIVQIEERTPVMMTEKDGMYLYIDSEGYLLGTYTEADKPDMPLIKGVDIKNYKIGASIADGKNVHIDNAIKICSMMKQLSMLSYIDIIDVSDYNNISMHCSPSLTVKFGGADDAGRKLSYIKGVVDSGYNGESNGVLDVSAGGNPIFKENVLPEETLSPEPTPTPQSTQ